MVVGSRFEERLTKIAQAELIALLGARVNQMEMAEEYAIAEQIELEEAMMVEFQVENRESMGGWA